MMGLETLDTIKPTKKLSWMVHPAVITLLVMWLLVIAVLAANAWNPLSLARLGTRYLDGDPSGSEGYDGQFIYYIARQLQPLQVAPFLDVPAYRYQRILLPLLGWLLSLGVVNLVPWTLMALGVASQAAGTWLVSEILAGCGVSRWYALVYGLWVGFVLAVRLDLPEPLAFALVAGAILAGERGHPRLGWILYGLALFAKEVTIAFVLAALLSGLAQHRWQDVLGLLLVAIAPYFMFQGWLWWVYGQPGIGSGGNMATPFELIPFMGLWRIANYSLAYLGAMLLVFGPATLLPTIWGLWAALKKLLERQTNVVVLALLINALLIVSLPFSTFRETGGLLRFMCGLVLAVLLFAARYKTRRVLNYSWLWLILNAFVLKSGGF
jgi:hypothetical protein